MKIAVLSDIHGHLPALEATAAHLEQWHPDVVIVNGDIVNRGPRPQACWAFVQTQRQTAGWLVTRGNHEDYVSQYLNTADDYHPLSFWTFEQMRRDEVVELAQLPLIETVHHPQGGEVRAVHASMTGTRYGVWHHSPAEEVRRQIAPAPAVYLTGHIHYPFVRAIDDTLIVNSGSTGTVCDHGDRRATYAQVMWHNGRWSAEIARVAYDYDQTERDYRQSGVLEGGGPIAWLVYEEWRTGWPILPIWMKDERWRRAEQELGTEAAVTQFFEELDLEQVKKIVTAFYGTPSPPR